MTHYNNLSVKLPNLQLIKLKSAIKKEIEVTLVILIMRLIFHIHYY